MDANPKYDVCIIGAGVAGGVLAAYLGKNGLNVAVIEKNLSEQERIIGELLQPGGVIKLKELGLEFLLEGFDAQTVEGYGLFMNGGNFKIQYPQENGKVLTGRGFRNGKFVQKIREYILSLPNVNVFEGGATALVESGGRVNGVKYQSKKEDIEKTIEADLTVVCDGMFSIFREGLSKNEKKVTSYFLGMVLKNCDLPYKNYGHVVVANPSPCLIYPISSTETRILIDFPWSEAPRKGPELLDYLNKIIAPQLPPQILPSFNAAVEEGKFKVMPNHRMAAKPIHKSGIALIGDSLNMRHPLTGGGMTAAFTDIKNLGTRLIKIHPFKNISGLDKSVQEFYRLRHQQNATINILADALYGVMRNEDLKAACYGYMYRGGVYADEPVAILSAKSRDVDLLLKHFFAVAFFGIGTMMKPFPTPAKIKRSYKMLQSAVQIVSPLVMNEKPGLGTRIVFKMASVVF